MIEVILKNKILYTILDPKSIHFQDGVLSFVSYFHNGIPYTTDSYSFPVPQFEIAKHLYKGLSASVHIMMSEIAFIKTDTKIVYENTHNNNGTDIEKDITDLLKEICK